jgi:hypothetical protein
MTKEKQISTKKAFKFLKDFKRMEEQRVANIIILENSIKELYPAVKNIYITSDTIEVTTKNHILRRTKCSSDSWKAMPTFLCSKNIAESIDTVEEFIAMKEAIFEDYKQCLSAVFYIQFRHDIKH